MDNEQVSKFVDSLFEYEKDCGVTRFWANYDSRCRFSVKIAIAEVRTFCNVEGIELSPQDFRAVISEIHDRKIKHEREIFLKQREIFLKRHGYRSISDIRSSSLQQL